MQIFRHYRQTLRFFGGIYRDVNFIVTPKTHISTTHYASSGVYISTSEVTVRYFDDRKDNIAWVPEQEYSAGSWGYIGGECNRPLSSDRKSTLPATMNIDFPNTINDPLWQTQRKGIEAFKADVPDGKYCVMLYFAEWESNVKKENSAYLLGGGAASSNGAAEPVFDAAINGVKVLNGFDITAEAGAEYALTKKFTVDVDDGKGLSIDFTPNQG